jgi:hypothetical protein
MIGGRDANVASTPPLPRAPRGRTPVARLATMGGMRTGTMNRRWRELRLESLRRYALIREAAMSRALIFLLSPPLVPGLARAQDDRP